MASPTIAERAGALVAAGRPREAARLLGAAAEAGDGGGLFALALWRIQGHILRRDLAAARDLLARAARAGAIDGALIHAYFLANGVGGPPDWPAAVSALRALAGEVASAANQLALLDVMDLDHEGYPATESGRETIGAVPETAASRGFLSPAECGYLIAAALPGMMPSMVVDPASGRMVPHPVRTSDYSLFGVLNEDLVASAINRRIAALSGTRYEQGEPLQVLRYTPGGEYRAHLDALPGADNQRVMTILVYLNDSYEGGETRFTHSGLAFRGAVGDALLFRNVGADGRPDPRAQHAGSCVRRGTKYLASRWIRATTFTFPPPTPLLPD